MKEKQCEEDYLDYSPSAKCYPVLYDSTDEGSPANNTYLHSNNCKLFLLIT